MSPGGGVMCPQVEGDVSPGGGGNVSPGGGGGNVSPGRGVMCLQVGGNVSPGGGVMCPEVEPFNNFNNLFTHCVVNL